LLKNKGEGRDPLQKKKKKNKKKGKKSQFVLKRSPNGGALQSLNPTGKFRLCREVKSL